MRFALSSLAVLLAGAGAASAVSPRDVHHALVARQSSSSSSSSSSGSSSSSQAAEPTAPSGSDVFRAGGQCTMQWTAGSGNKWKHMTISLMTGTNLHMTKLTDIATNVDGTSETSYSWTCPEVSPYSAIYFYQFTDADGNNPQWTTRWTIASPDGDTVPPPEDNQPENPSPAVPWGEGKLLSTSSSSGSSNSSSSGSTAAGSSGSSSTSSSSGSATRSSSSSSSSSTETATAAGAGRAAGTTTPNGAAALFRPTAAALVAVAAVAVLL